MEISERRDGGQELKRGYGDITVCANGETRKAP